VFSSLSFADEKPKGWNIVAELKNGAIMLVNLDYAKPTRVSMNKVILAKIRIQYSAETQYEMEKIIKDIIKKSLRLNERFPLKFNIDNYKTTVYPNHTNWNIKYSEKEIVFDPNNNRFVIMKSETFDEENKLIILDQYYDSVLALSEKSSWDYIASNQGLNSVMEYLLKYVKL